MFVWRTVLFLHALWLGPGMVCAQPRATLEASGFSAEQVQAFARELASKPFVTQEKRIPEPWASIDYDKHRDIRFRPEKAIWHGEGKNFELQLMPAGWLFKFPVEIFVVEDGRAKPITPDNSYFQFGSVVGQPQPADPPIGFSGLRVNGPINLPRVFDEIVVFQGASYFRAVSSGQNYGLSARGLAIDVGQPAGEEFPFFRSFWVETPSKNARELVVHALLDSPSSSGAYTFRIIGGTPTVTDVDVKLFPRRDITRIGISPLTSMFLFSGFNRSRIQDFRPAVHDSDGLSIYDAGAERIWRPLNNPMRLQESAFNVRNLTGFGLIQRKRMLADYEDLEAHYERRPSAWIEPRGSWGKGSVHLVEIPIEEEIHDNIVAFWRPEAPYKKGGVYDFGYRITWSNDVPLPWQEAVVVKTLSGLANGQERKGGAIRYAVDFVGPALKGREDGLQAVLRSSAGRVTTPVVLHNPATGGVRVDFLLNPDDADVIELRLELKNKDKSASEVWLSRWTK
jgi:periplasmic glucans biosynthesis protein